MSTEHYNGEYAGFLSKFLRNARSLDKVQQLRRAAAKRRSFATEEALWDGFFALEREVEEAAKQLTIRGQLLLAWEGTNALEGRVQ